MSRLKLSNRLSRVRVSPTVAISARAEELRAQGKDIVSLSSGEPDFDTPKNIRSAAQRAMENGKTHYTSVEGIPELLQAICGKLEADNHLSYQPNEIIVGAGGKQIIFNAMMATLEPGDEVIIPAPYWVSYPDIVLLFSGEPVYVSTTERTSFKVTAEQLQRTITPKTRWIFLNSPSNPTGAVYSKEDFKKIGEVLLNHPQVWVMTDDIYEKMIYDGLEFCSFAEAAPALKSRTLTVNGLSKSHAMTGWRIGYGAADSSLIAAMKKIQGQSTMHPCSIAQWAAVEALEGPQDFLDEMSESFDRRRQITMAALDQIDGLRCFKPGGAFYLFISIADQLGQTSAGGKKLTNDYEWVMALMEEQGVALVPGSAFGTEGYARLSYAASEQDLSQACERITRFCQSLS